MIGFLSSPLARWIGAGALALAFLFSAYVKGRMDENKKLVEYRAKIVAEAAAQQKALDSLVKHRTQLTQKAEANHAKSVANLRSTYAALRLRSATSGCNVSQAPDPTREPDAAAAYYISVAPELAEWCAQTTQQLTDMQDWLNDQQQAE